MLVVSVLAVGGQRAVVLVLVAVAVLCLRARLPAVLRRRLGGERPDLFDGHEADPSADHSAKEEKNNDGPPVPEPGWIVAPAQFCVVCQRQMNAFGWSPRLQYGRAGLLVAARPPVARGVTWQPREKEWKPTV